MIKKQKLSQTFLGNSEGHKAASCQMMAELHSSQVSSSSSSSIKVHPSETRVFSYLCCTCVARDGDVAMDKKGHLQVKNDFG